jgi:hypothetical protein
VATAPHLERIRHLSWPGFSFVLPLGWEIAAYRLDALRGQIELSERTTARGQLSWRVVPAVPDQKRILNEIHRRNLDPKDKKRVETFSGLDFDKAGDFLFGFEREGEIAQASLFVPEQKLLVEWVFPAYEKARLPAIRELLRSSRRNDGELVRWELFGIRALLPRTHTYASIDPQPANVAITFETKKDMTLVLRRIGMTREVLSSTSLGRLVRTFIRRGAGRVLEVEERSVLGYAGVFAKFDRRGQRGFEKLTGRWWPGEAWLWHDTDEDRIYGLEQVGPAKRSRVDLEQAMLASGRG